MPSAILSTLKARRPTRIGRRPHMSGAVPPLGDALALFPSERGDPKVKMSKRAACRSTFFPREGDPLATQGEK